jgi:hypothetical protein
MGTTQTAPTLFSCSVRDCSLTFNSQRELILHEGEWHGELGHSRPAGSQHSGVISANELESHGLEKHSEKGIHCSPEEAVRYHNTIAVLHL